MRRAKAQSGVVVRLPSSAASSKRERSRVMAALSVAEAEQLLQSSVPPWMVALQLQVQLADKHVTLELTEAARLWLAQHGFEPLYGARPWRA